MLCGRVDLSLLRPEWMTRLPSSLRHLSLTAAYWQKDPNPGKDMLRCVGQLEALSLHDFRGAPTISGESASLRAVVVGSQTVSLHRPVTQRPLRGAKLCIVAAGDLDVWNQTCPCNAVAEGDAALKLSNESSSACAAFGRVHITFNCADITDLCPICGSTDHSGTVANSAAARFVELLTRDTLPASLELWSAAGNGAFAFRWRLPKGRPTIMSEEYATSAALMAELTGHCARAQQDCSLVQMSGRTGVLITRRDVSS